MGVRSDRRVREYEGGRRKMERVERGGMLSLKSKNEEAARQMYPAPALLQNTEEPLCVWHEDWY